MAIFGVYIINRAGGLIYQYDHNMPRVEVEKTFSYPLELVLKIYDEKVVVAFGQRDGVKGKLKLGFTRRMYSLCCGCCQCSSFWDQIGQRLLI